MLDEDKEVLLILSAVITIIQFYKKLLRFFERLILNYVEVKLEETWNPL